MSLKHIAKSHKIVPDMIVYSLNHTGLWLQNN